jgi:hypothetical protein
MFSNSACYYQAQFIFTEEVRKPLDQSQKSFRNPPQESFLKATGVDDFSQIS